MKISKIILPLVGLCALTSCGTKTSKNNFFEAAKDVESHSYKSYVVKYSEESNTGSIETKVSYTFKDNQWDADQINSYTMSFSTYSSPMVTYADDYETYLDYYEEDAKSEDSNAKIEKEVRYYIKPFKIVVSFNCSYKNEKGSGKELMEIKRKERAEDAKEVENAFRAIKEAEEIYYKKLNEFIDKYGYYHYSSKDVKDFPSVFSLFKPFFNNWF